MNPTISELYRIKYEISSLLNEYGLKSVDIIFTGSSVLNILGLMEGVVKDVDVIISVPDEDYLKGSSLELFENTLLRIFQPLECREAGKDDSGSEVLMKLTIANYDIEIFSNIGRKYIELKDGVKISLIKDMFNKKKVYNKDKTLKHVEKIIDHLMDNKQSDHKDISNYTMYPDMADYNYGPKDDLPF